MESKNICNAILAIIGSRVGQVVKTSTLFAMEKNIEDVVGGKAICVEDATSAGTVNVYVRAWGHLFVGRVGGGSVVCL